MENDIVKHVFIFLMKYNILNLIYIFKKIGLFFLIYYKIRYFLKTYFNLFNYFLNQNKNSMIPSTNETSLSERVLGR